MEILVGLYLGGKHRHVVRHEDVCIFIIESVLRIWLYVAV